MLICRFSKNSCAKISGQDLIEYALIAAFIAIAAMKALSSRITNEFNNIGNSL